MNTWQARAHPRSRGENGSDGFDSGGHGGSSPLTRGKHLVEDGENFVSGLIPAHAGKTRQVMRAYPDTGAHPRSRGENGTSRQTCGLYPGSSPLTRGKPARRAGGQAVAGLIPAHAGKTTMSTSALCLLWAHPRSRGENRS